MKSSPRHRLAVSETLEKNHRIVMDDTAAHYLTHVLRLGVGDCIGLFNGLQGEWLARLQDIRKKHVTLVVEEKLRAAQPVPDFMVCFALVKAGRLETILEKATELGASIIQPVITARTVVDKLNIERAGNIVREAAGQCERTCWPAIHNPVKLLNLLADWPAERTLIYGDESGQSVAFTTMFEGSARSPKGEPQASAQRGGTVVGAERPLSVAPNKWAILTGPEGGFTEEEFRMLQKTQGAVGVSLGPRILRADTAVISLSTLTMSQWGDWQLRPNFESETHA